MAKSYPEVTFYRFAYTYLVSMKIYRNNIKIHFNTIAYFSTYTLYSASVSLCTSTHAHGAWDGRRLARDD